MDDRAMLGGAALRPYGLLAFELDTTPGVGQVDGGLRSGRYLELGMAPGYAARRASIAFPITVGLSLGNYYELAGTGHAFGFASVASMVTVPFGGTTTFGSWNLHGGAEYQVLGETTKAFNRGDASKLVGSIGVGFSY